MRPEPTVPIRKATTPVTVRSFDAGGLRHNRPDRLATEEPLQILIGGPSQPSVPVAVTMRTPGHDFEHAVGFCFSEALIGPYDVREVKYCEVPADEPQLYNVVTVRTGLPVVVEARPFTTTSSCGICGTATLDEVEKTCAVLDPSGGPFVTAGFLSGLPERLQAAQKVFAATGGLHAAALFDAGTGALIALREDVGRHNAVDKLIGRSVLDRSLPLSGAVLMVSGRTSFEIVQKAAMAGIGVVAAVSAPSSLAVSAAERFGLTLVGFVREGRGNVYSRPERIVAAPTV